MIDQLKILDLKAKRSAKRLYQQVAETLLSYIESGEYTVGSRLPAERELAASFEVSRPTIREAIVALELAGYVDVRTGSGVYVLERDKSLRPQMELDIGPFELLEARALFEGEAAALAARNITDEEILGLEAAIDDMIAENKKKKLHMETADRKFHVLIAEATGNSAVVRVVNDLWDIREGSRLTARMLDKVRKAGWKPRIDEHRAIYEAIAARNPARARERMREHMMRVIDQVLEATEVEAVNEAKRRVHAERERFTAARKLK